MKSRDLTKAYERAKRAYEEACATQEALTGILDAIPITGSRESALRRDVKPIAENATQAVEKAFDVKDGLEDLIEELQAMEENEATSE